MSALQRASANSSCSYGSVSKEPEIKTLRSFIFLLTNSIDYSGAL